MICRDTVVEFDTQDDKSGCQQWQVRLIWVPTVAAGICICWAFIVLLGSKDLGSCTCSQPEGSCCAL